MAGSISTLGVGSGLELQDILDQLREVDQAVIDQKQDDVVDLETQLEEFTKAKNNILTLKSAVLDLSLNSTFLGRTVSSSDEDVIEASVIDGATVKNSSLEVVKLAEQSSWLSAGVSSSNDSISTGDSQFSYTVGEDTITLDVAAGTSVSQLADLINDDSVNPGITASVINTGESSESYKLFVQADNAGDDYKIDLLSVPDLMSMSRQQDGTTTLDAQFKVDGVTYQRDSNTVNDALSGVTLTLKSVGTSTITVGDNSEGLKDKIVAMVEAYYDFDMELREKTGYDAEAEEFGILNSTTLRDLPYELQNLMSTSNSGDTTQKVRTMFDLGFEFVREGILKDEDGNPKAGTIKIDEEVLLAAIKEHPDEVKAFFLGDSDRDVEGFADTVNNRLRTLTLGSGIIEGEKSAAKSKIYDLELLIEEDTARLDKKYENLTARFVALDQFMNEMTSMSSFLTGQFNNLSDGWSSRSSDS